MSRVGSCSQTRVATGENVRTVPSTGEAGSHVSHDGPLPPRPDERWSDVPSASKADGFVDVTAFPRWSAVRNRNVPADGATHVQRTRVPVPFCRSRRPSPAAGNATPTAESTPLDDGDSNADLGEGVASCSRVASDALQSDTPSSEAGSKTNEDTRNPYDDK